MAAKHRVLLKALTIVAVLLPAACLRAQALDGVIDVHVHCAPDVIPRVADVLEIARQARDRGLRGLVLKSHDEPTASLAYLARKVVPGIELFGGIVLNQTVGGINPTAVEQMTKITGNYGRVVWMPTRDSENQVRKSGENRSFVAVTRNSRLLPEVHQVLRSVALHRLTLATGHLSPEETLLLIEEARRAGVDRILVTHPMHPAVAMTVQQMRKAAALGAYIEFPYNFLIGPNKSIELSTFAATIREVGPTRCVLSSDLGQPENPLPADGLLEFFSRLQAQGFTPAEIDTMSKTNPAAVLGLGKTKGKNQ